MASIKDQMASVDPSDWARDFTARCEAKERENLPEWRREWKSLANGKLVLKEVYKELGATLSFADFKRRIVAEMLSKETQDWKEVDAILETVIPR